MVNNNTSFTVNNTFTLQGKNVYNIFVTIISVLKLSSFGGLLTNNAVFQ